MIARLSEWWRGRRQAAAYHRENARHRTPNERAIPADPPAPAQDPDRAAVAHSAAGASAGAPAGAGAPPPGRPFLARYIRLQWPQPDDTVFDLPPIPGKYMPSARTVLGALGRPRWPC